MSNDGDSSLPGPGEASSGPALNPTAAEDATLSPFVNLQVVSPSSQVASPLSFQLLPATTTVKELKERIRNALDVSPSAESQRLIYRGRMLARDSETMMEIFGEETLRTPEQQTFHLVLRPPVADTTASYSSTPIASPNPQMDRAHSQPHVPGPSLPSGPRLGSTEHPSNLPPIQPSAPGPRRVPQIPPFHQQHPLQTHNDLQHRLLLQRIQAQHDEMTEQLNYLTQEQRIRMNMGHLNPANGQLPPGFQVTASYPPTAPGTVQFGLQNPANIPGNQQYALPNFQNVLAQQLQQGRAHGPQAGPIPNNTAQSTIFSGPPSRTQSPALPHGHTPDQTTTFTRHGVNSNGERWQITVNESTTVIPPGNSQHRVPAQPGHGDITSNLQHLLQTAERISAMQARINNLTQRPGIAPGNPVTSAPQRPASTPPIGRVARPTSRSVNSLPVPSVVPSTNTSSTPLSNDPPVVYIMSSPNGPQALLINNSQTFYSPGHSYITHQTANGPPSEVRNRRDRPHRHRHRHRDANVPVADGAGAQAPAEPAQNAHQHAQPLRIAVLPHAWLIVRLIIFVWWFAYGNNSSWYRVFTIWGIALVLFIVNTGVFNEVFGAFWNPIRQHLENLLPLAAPNPQLAAGVPERREGDAAPALRREPNPEEVARRLLEQRRQEDASWMMTQFRRIEHAVLLFVASIVPGTAERHIEARTMEENRLLEERRQQAAAAAAALEPTPTENPEGEAANAPTVPTLGEAVVEGSGEGGAPIGHRDDTNNVAAAV